MFIYSSKNYLIALQNFQYNHFHDSKSEQNFHTVFCIIFLMNKIYKSFVIILFIVFLFCDGTKPMQSSPYIQAVISLYSASLKSQSRVRMISFIEWERILHFLCGLHGCGHMPPGNCDKCPY